jgi:anti-sigma factor RsiW
MRTQARRWLRSLSSLTVLTIAGLALAAGAFAMVIGIGEVQISAGRGGSL